MNLSEPASNEGGLGPYGRLAIHADGVPPPAGPYSHAVRVGDLLFISGQGPFDAFGKLVVGTFEDHVRVTFDNLARIAAAAGGDLRNIVRLGAFLADYGNFARYNDVMRSYLNEPYPARTTIPVPTLGIPIELDAVVAMRPASAGPAL
jgi:2-iminobutanoate/2-iminopropanoate deaminase